VTLSICLLILYAIPMGVLALPSKGQRMNHVLVRVCATVRRTRVRVNNSARQQQRRVHTLIQQHARDRVRLRDVLERVRLRTATLDRVRPQHHNRNRDHEQHAPCEREQHIEPRHVDVNIYVLHVGLEREHYLVCRGLGENVA
jgi:hypothetical protein